MKKRSVFRWLFVAAAMASPVAAFAADFECRPITPMPREISIRSRYAPEDLTYSTIDPARMTQQTDYRKRFTLPLRAAMFAAKRAAASRDPHDEIACLAGYFDAFAKAQSMEGTGKELDNVYRSWTISGLATIYYRFQGDLDKYPSAGNVHQWFDRTGKDLISQYQPILKSGRITNHLYWGGEAVTVLGVVNKNQQFLAFGSDVLRTGVAQIDADGAMPAELARGKMARHYHMFAAVPLVAITVFNPDTVQASHGNNDGLTRLISATVASYGAPDGGVIARKSRAAQTPDASLKDLKVLQYYSGIDPKDRDLLKTLTATTPNDNVYFGGDTSFMLGGR